MPTTHNQPFGHGGDLPTPLPAPHGAVFLAHNRHVRAAVEEAPFDPTHDAIHDARADFVQLLRDDPRQALRAPQPEHAAATHPGARHAGQTAVHRAGAEAHDESQTAIPREHWITTTDPAEAARVALAQQRPAAARAAGRTYNMRTTHVAADARPEPRRSAEPTVTHARTLDESRSTVHHAVPAYSTPVVHAVDSSPRGEALRRDVEDRPGLSGTHAMPKDKIVGPQAAGRVEKQREPRAPRQPKVEPETHKAIGIRIKHRIGARLKSLDGGPLFDALDAGSLEPIRKAHRESYAAGAQARAEADRGPGALYRTGKAVGALAVGAIVIAGKGFHFANPWNDERRERRAAAHYNQLKTKFDNIFASDEQVPTQDGEPRISPIDDSPNASQYRMPVPAEAIAHSSAIEPDDEDGQYDTKPETAVVTPLLPAPEDSFPQLPGTPEEPTGDSSDHLDIPPMASTPRARTVEGKTATAENELPAATSNQAETAQTAVDEEQTRRQREADMYMYMVRQRFVKSFRDNPVVRGSRTETQFADEMMGRWLGYADQFLEDRRLGKPLVTPQHTAAAYADEMMKQWAHYAEEFQRDRLRGKGNYLIADPTEDTYVSRSMLGHDDREARAQERAAAESDPNVARTQKITRDVQTALDVETLVSLKESNPNVLEADEWKDNEVAKLFLDYTYGFLRGLEDKSESIHRLLHISDTLTDIMARSIAATGVHLKITDAEAAQFYGAVKANIERLAARADQDRRRVLTEEPVSVAVR